MKKTAFIISALILFCGAGFAQNGYTTPQQSLSGVWTAIILIIIVLLGLIGAAAYYILIIEKKKKSSRKKNHDHDHHLIMEGSIESLKQRLTDLEQKMDSIKNTSSAAKHESKSGAERQQPAKEAKNPAQTAQTIPASVQTAHNIHKSPAIQYPKTIIQNGFRDDLSDKQGDSYFKFFDIKDNNASFEFCGTDFEKAKANKDTLEIVCEISGASVTAHAIENEKPGSVQLKDGKWEIIKKAKIKFV